MPQHVSARKERPPVPPELNVPTPPRPFNPAGPPRSWLPGDEKPPLWPEPITLSVGFRSMATCGVIYRFFDAKRQLLYLGQTSGDPTYRWRQHRNSPWWKAAAFVSVAHVTPVLGDRLVLEREAIQAERPLHNKQHNDRPYLRFSIEDEPADIVKRFRTALSVEDFAALVLQFASEAAAITGTRT